MHTIAEFDFVELAESLGHMAVSVDLMERRIVYASPGAARVLGPSAGESLSGEALTRLLDRIFPDEPTRQRMRRLMEGDTDGNDWLDYPVTIDGRTLWRGARLRLVRVDGRPARLDLLSTDITELVESRRAAARQSALRQISERLHEAETLDAAVAIVCEEVIQLLGVSASTLYFFDDDSGILRAAHVRGPWGSGRPGVVTREQLATIHRVHGRLAQFLDVATVEELPNRALMASIGIRSFATAAIGSGSTPLGVLNVACMGVTCHFEPHEMQLLEGVAALIAGPLARVALADEVRRHHAQLEVAEERLRAALDGADTGIWSLDVRSGQLVFDRRCYELWELDPSLPPDMSLVLARIPEEDRAALVEARLRAVQPGSSGQYATEYRFQARTGRTLRLASRGLCSFDETGQPVRMTGTVMDETARHELEEARLAIERRYREIVVTMSEGVGLLDPMGRITLVNPAYERLFGYAEAELLSMHIEELMFPEDRESERLRWLQHLERGGGPLRAVRRFRARDGRELWVSLATVPVMEQGQLTAILGILTDITESRRLEQKLQQSQKLESLGVLAGGIAHDFNNLLVGILGNAGLALGDLPPESPARDAIASIETASKRASELTRQLLAYAGKGRFVISRIDLRRLVEEMGHLLAAVMGKGVILRYQFGDGVPVVEGDATQLRQVVMNLITNASDAIGERSGIVTVATSLIDVDRSYLAETLLDDSLTPGYYACFQVSDTGAGMSAETRQRIFDPFFTTKFTGRGLGLAAVLGIVRAHRGAIKVYSELGRGSTFKLLLPVAEGPADVARPAVAAAPFTDTGTILVIDDEDTVRNVMKRVLMRAGFQVLTAFDGVDGLQVFSVRRSEIRAVILDVTMPRMGGEETFRQLRRIDPEVRVLLSSGYSEQEATSQFAGMGLAGFIEKPFNPQVLLEKIRGVLTATGMGGEGV